METINNWWCHKNKNAVQTQSVKRKSKDSSEILPFPEKIKICFWNIRLNFYAYWLIVFPIDFIVCFYKNGCHCCWRSENVIFETFSRPWQIQVFFFIWLVNNQIQIKPTYSKTNLREEKYIADRYMLQT